MSAEENYNSEFASQLLLGETILTGPEYKETVKSDREAINKLMGEEQYAGQVEHSIHRKLEGKQTIAGLGEWTRSDVSKRADKIREMKSAYDSLDEQNLEVYFAAMEGPQSFLDVVEDY